MLNFTYKCNKDNILYHKVIVDELMSESYILSKSNIKLIDENYNNDDELNEGFFNKGLKLKDIAKICEKNKKNCNKYLKSVIIALLDKVGFKTKGNYMYALRKCDYFINSNGRIFIFDVSGNKIKSFSIDLGKDAESDEIKKDCVDFINGKKVDNFKFRDKLEYVLDDLLCAIFPNANLDRQVGFRW